MASDVQEKSQYPPNVAPRPTTQITIGCLLIPLIVVVIVGIVFFSIRAQATTTFTVPDGDVLLVYAEPDPTSPLLARYGAGRNLNILGRSEDWRWLKVALWDGQFGWALRPLDILVWQLEADISPATVAPTTLEPVTPVGQTMITIPATTFTMGSPPGIGSDDERPAHAVSLSAFAMDQTEVTVGQYWQCVMAGSCAAPSTDISQGDPHYYNDPAFDNHPAINLPWNEANNYCTWQNKRLPTEAEWELAASWHFEKSAKFQWPWGSVPEPGAANIAEAGLGKPTVVGQFSADVSPAGVLDMAGNVSEWVFDWYKIDYYSVADDTNPLGPSHRRGEGTGRVVRGGSFVDAPAEARTTSRRHQAETYGYPTIGFRCAKNVAETP